MKKIMISVAPVAATDILINPRAIARDVYECYKNGASMVHLHCRDLNGNLTPDLSLLEETVAYIREMCDIVVEISTGGVSNLTIEERVQPCYPSWVEANSLNVGSVNLGTSVYQNPMLATITEYITRLTLPSRLETTRKVLAKGEEEIERFVELHRQLLSVIERRQVDEIAATVQDHYIFWKK